MNAYDCGAFIMMYSECLLSGIEPDFSQGDIRDFRIRVAETIQQISKKN